MKALTREAVDEELGDYLTSDERKALLARRDVLVTLVESLGPTALYDRNMSRHSREPTARPCAAVACRWLRGHG